MIISRLIRKILVATAALACLESYPSLGASGNVTCLGRVEPLGGVSILAGPSGTDGKTAVIAEVRVSEGDWVEKGQILAVLDDYRLRSAELARQNAMVEDVRVRLKRLESLSRTQSTSRAKLDEVRYELRALEADQKVFEERREMSLIRAPDPMQVLKIHVDPGERVGKDGVMELGQTRQMSVIAEVYETDIGRVRPGQEAIIRSPALPSEVKGQVTDIGFQVGRMDVLDIDPVARTDARVIEVIITLGENSGLDALTNLQVDVEILM